MWWQLRAAVILYGGAVRCVAQYRADLVFSMIAGLLFQGSGFLTVWVILARFDAIAGWSISDMALLYGMRLCSHGLWVVLLSPLSQLSRYIREGTFDRFLVRPVNPLVQLMTTRIWFAPVGDLIGGIVLLGVAVTLVNVEWTAWKVAFLIVALIGGALLEGGVQLGLSCTSFRFVKADQLRFTTDQIFSMFGNYPAKIFGGIGLWALTAVIPVVFVAYLPASVLLGHAEATGLPSWLAYASPLAGLVVTVVGYRIWMYQLRNYTGTGT
ncbi:ABC transporter permease [Stackebrandtia nassauensis]|uniref:ABC transporter permease protein n=1 Tax=Stackebrandtia nassauensis (strain DSM 44728 / CIP 108903 / NRRL B-16338 / NBRC 102104 / LLR-40K-21) TaxID=446470 RepID=D3Q5U0_STANL|nr:ABC-2 family transporter protein [Stackebrandtia nassauensis]ADD40239.1 protein of unknown function DUF990 [Stackebrandtia nassauensis DSM 44728]